MGKWDWEIDREDGPCICVVNLNRWRQTLGGGGQPGSAGGVSSDLASILFLFSVYKHTKQERKKGEGRGQERL